MHLIFIVMCLKKVMLKKQLIKNTPEIILILFKFLLKNAIVSFNDSTKIPHKTKGIPNPKL